MGKMIKTAIICPGIKLYKNCVIEDFAILPY